MTLVVECGAAVVGPFNCWAYLPEWFWLLVGPVGEWAMVIGGLAAVALELLQRYEVPGPS